MDGGRCCCQFSNKSREFTNSWPGNLQSDGKFQTAKTNSKDTSQSRRWFLIQILSVSLPHTRSCVLLPRVHRCVKALRNILRSACPEGEEGSPEEKATTFVASLKPVRKVSTKTGFFFFFSVQTVDLQSDFMIPHHSKTWVQNG